MFSRRMTIDRKENFSCSGTIFSVKYLLIRSCSLVLVRHPDSFTGLFFQLNQRGGLLRRGESAYSG